MDYSTTIIHSGEPTPVLPQLTEKLRNFGMAVETTLPATYDETVEYYSRLKNNDFITAIPEGGVISPLMALTALFALLHNKPLIVTHTPSHTAGMDSFTKETLKKRFNKLLVCDLNLLDEQDTKSFIQNVVKEKVNYVLTNHEKILISARLRAYFRELLAT